MPNTRQREYPEPEYTSKRQRIDTHEFVIDESESDETDESGQSYLDSFAEELKGSDPDIYESYKKTLSELARTEPSIVKILREPLLIEHKAHLMQLYEIYRTCPPHTEEQLESRNNLNATFDKYRGAFAEYSKYTEKEHHRMSDVIKSSACSDTMASLKYKILNLDTSQHNKTVMYSEYCRLERLSSSDEEAGKLRAWLETAVSLPYDKIKTISHSTNVTLFLQEVSKRMDEELYGMREVKEKILVFLNAKLTNPQMKRCNLGLVGPPGVGKTAIARLLADVSGYPFHQISFGGVTSPSFLLGHEYTYVGAQSGAIVHALKNMGYKNGILLLDEFEKAADNEWVCDSLLHILDQKQNQMFTETYLRNLHLDLSHIWFVCSMNYVPKDHALRDRLSIVRVDGYCMSEKIDIVQKYVLPKAVENAGLPKGSVFIERPTASYLVSRVSGPGDRGVRSIEHAVNDIVNKVKFLVTNQDENGKLVGLNISFNTSDKLSYPVEITKDHVAKFVAEQVDNIQFDSVYIG